jgi:CheY-like chemotaxis protein
MENNPANNNKTVLMADDDIDDYILLKEAVTITRMPVDLYRVFDGVELLDYLQRRGKFSDIQRYPQPQLILLDINMPRKNGFEALAEIRAKKSFKQLPIVMYTTSNNEKDISRSISLGANSFITKPETFSAFSGILEEISKYAKAGELPATQKNPASGTAAWA